MTNTDGFEWEQEPLLRRQQGSVDQQNRFAGSAIKAWQLTFCKTYFTEERWKINEKKPFYGKIKKPNFKPVCEKIKCGDSIFYLRSSKFLPYQYFTLPPTQAVFRETVILPIHFTTEKI